MLWTPTPIAVANQVNLPATPTTTPGTTVTAAGSAHTKGSWTSLIDPVTRDGTLLAVMWMASGASATLTSQLMDIGIGPSGGGSEQVLLPNLMTGWAGTQTQTPFMIVVPMLIPRGVRISARMQSAVASATVRVRAAVLSGPQVPAQMYRGCDAYGVDTSTSTGTSHTAGSTGAESNWASIGSTTSRAYRAAMPLIHGISTTMNARAYHVELGYGSTTMGEWEFQTSTAEIVYELFPPFPIPMSIPSGTQMQIRAECSGTADQLSYGAYLFY